MKQNNKEIIEEEIDLDTLISISYALRHKWKNHIWANELDKAINKLKMLVQNKN